MQSKSTRSKPVAVKIQVITIPDELLQVNEDINLYIDGLNVNDLEFLATIAHDLYWSCLVGPVSPPPLYIFFSVQSSNLQL